VELRVPELARLAVSVVGEAIEPILKTDEALEF
jgi:hypothetical protein